MGDVLLFPTGEVLPDRCEADEAPDTLGDLVTRYAAKLDEIYAKRRAGDATHRLLLTSFCFEVAALKSGDPDEIG